MPDDSLAMLSLHRSKHSSSMETLGPAISNPDCYPTFGPKPLAAALAELEQARARGEFPGKKRLAAVRRTALAIDAAAEERAAAPPAALVAGAAVRVRGTAVAGVVGRVTGERVEVLVRDKRIWVEASACKPAVGPAAEPAADVEVTAEELPPAELKLIGLTQEEARERLEGFLDHAMLAGTAHVRVVHGHGTGTLRRLVREVLAHHPAVTRFEHPPQYRGGTGVTEADLEAR